MGTNSITLKGRHGTTTTYTTPGTTTYFEGKTAGVVGDLVVGDRVNLDLTTASPQTVTQVTICLVRWTGTVTGVSGNVISITAFHNTSLSVDVSGTTTYTMGGAASTLGAITTGAVISAVGVLGSAANTLDANSVNIGPSLRHGPIGVRSAARSRAGAVSTRQARWSKSSLTSSQYPIMRSSGDVFAGGSAFRHSGGRRGLP